MPPLLLVVRLPTLNVTETPIQHFFKKDSKWCPLGISPWLVTFEGDIGPAYARMVTGTSLGLFCCFQPWLSGLPWAVGSWILLSSETSGDQGPPIQGGVELSKDPMSGTKKLSMESPIKTNYKGWSHQCVTSLFIILTLFFFLKTTIREVEVNCLFWLAAHGVA